MNEQSIERIEKKYLITKRQKRVLLKSIKRNLHKDTYHKSGVLNLYFDNDNYDLISQSIDWVDFKEKIRARSYEGYDRVFLEVKTKIRAPRGNEPNDPDETREENTGFKRRIMITHEDFRKLINHEEDLVSLAKISQESSNDSQIAKEIDYLIKHFDLKPKILILYNRESYKDGQGLRITFDENLKYRNQNLSFAKGNHDKIYFKDDHNVIMEIKAHGVIPLWLVKRMSELKIYPQQFSKIGKIYQKIMASKDDELSKKEAVQVDQPSQII